MYISVMKCITPFTRNLLDNGSPLCCSELSL
jgi:hypothetical protein